MHAALLREVGVVWTTDLDKARESLEAIHALGCMAVISYSPEFGGPFLGRHVHQKQYCVDVRSGPLIAEFMLPSMIRQGPITVQPLARH